MSRWDHGLASNLKYGERNMGQSFLWSIVRDPTKRAVSQFFHFKVSRNHVPSNLDEFQKCLRSSVYRDYYLFTLETEVPQHRLMNNGHNNHSSPRSTRRQPQEAMATIQSIFQHYDFIGVTERMDETAVAFMMLVNGTLADILYLNAKVNGAYDDICTWVQPTVLKPKMQAFLDSDEWHDIIQWDQQLYQLANQSLDLTIERLGAQAFLENLQKFRQAQAVIHETCGKLEVYPCTSSGKRNPDRNCLWADSGCGYSCINKVAAQLGLDKTNPPSIPLPRL